MHFRLIVSVSFERLLAIKQPFQQARNSACNTRLVLLLTGVFSLSAALTFHHNVAFRVKKNGNNSTTKINDTIEAQWNDYVQASTFVNILLVYVAPLVILCIVDSTLIYYLRKRHSFFPIATTATTVTNQQMRHRTESQLTTRSADASASIPLRSINSAPLTDSNYNKKASTIRLALSADDNDDSRRSPSTTSTVPSAASWSRQLNSSQRHVTLMVTVIITAFVISYTPSVCVFVYNHHRRQADSDRQLSLLVSLLSNALVISGKVANFFLFCTSSRHFRVRLRQIICRDRRQLSNQTHHNRSLFDRCLNRVCSRSIPPPMMMTSMTIVGEQRDGGVLTTSSKSFE